MPYSSKILRTGGGVFIGWNLTEQLTIQSAKVTIIDKLITGCGEILEEIKGNFDFIECDVNNESKLKQIIEEIEIVFHQAALPSVPRSSENPSETHEARVNGTFNLLLISTAAGVRPFIYVVSS